MESVVKTNIATREIDISGDFETKSFSIRADGKAFKILIDSLYSNKPLAIVRELWSNAYDSHRLAGCEDRAFECHIPKTMEPWFSVRDFGVSMTHDEVMNRYTTVFDSSKEDDNVGVGKFGLGCKTPFSMSDTFSVVAYKGGKARSYNMFLDAHSVPTIAYVGETDTDEEDGLYVEIPVNPNDFYYFKSSAQTAGEGFTVKPIMTGDHVSLKTRQASISGDRWEYYTQYGTAKARQGCVIYPIDVNAMRGLKDIQRQVLNNDILLDFDIGELDVTPSRESLQYDRQTISNIIKKLDAMIADLKSKFTAEVNAATTLWEARIAMMKIVDTCTIEPIVNSIQKDGWNGKPLVPYTEHTVDDIPGVRMWYISNRYIHTRESAYFPSVKRSPRFMVSYRNPVIYLEDTTQKVKDAGRKVHKHAREHGNDVLWVKADPSSFAYKRFLATFCRPTKIVDISTIDYARQKAEKKYYDKLFYYRSGWFEYEYDSLEDIDADYYIDLEFGRPVHYHNGVKTPIDGYRDFIVSLTKITGNTFKVVGVPRCSHKLVAEAGWRSITEVAGDYIEKTFDPEVTFKHIDYDQFTEMSMPSSLHLIDHLVKKVKGNTGTAGEFVEMIKAVRADLSGKQSTAIDLYKFAVNFGFLQYSFINVSSTEKAFKKLLKEYPLLKSVSYDYEGVVEYIELIDAKKAND